MGEWHGVSTHGYGRVGGLHLGGNQLSGEIPSELGNLANLIELGLSQNQLSGEIPRQLGNLANLGNLELHENQLSGCVPQRLDREVGIFDVYVGMLPFCEE